MQFKVKGSLTLKSRKWIKKEWIALFYSLMYWALSMPLSGQIFGDIVAHGAAPLELV